MMRIIKGDLSRVWRIRVKFPAYEQISIAARSAEIVLDRARPALDSARQKADALT